MERDDIIVQFVQRDYGPCMKNIKRLNAFFIGIRPEKPLHNLKRASSYFDNAPTTPCYRP
jgi:hypothetical protein